MNHKTRIINPFNCLFFTLIVLSFTISAKGDTVVLESQKDNTLYENAGGTLSNGAGQFLFAGRTSTLSGQLIRRGLLNFDLSSIPTGSTIDSVDLTLFMSRSISGTQNVNVHELIVDWGEGSSNAGGQEGGGAAASAGDATWIHTFSATDFWATAGGDFDAAASASQAVGGIGSYTWNSSSNLVADVQGWLDNSASNFGWSLVGEESVGTTAKQFFSRENADVANRPTLTVNFTTAVPEPGSGLLLASIAIMALWFSSSK